MANPFVHVELTDSRAGRPHGLVALRAGRRCGGRDYQSEIARRDGLQGRHGGDGSGLVGVMSDMENRRMAA